jgi:hypothetical protein
MSIEEVEAEMRKTIDIVKYDKLLKKKGVKLLPKIVDDGKRIREALTRINTLCSKSLKRYEQQPQQFGMVVAKINSITERALSEAKRGN